jgi:N6-adenosine-specific RNA methylase IME4
MCALLSVPLPKGCVVLIDVPSSIEHAQDSHLRIKSCTPLAQPFESTEPKGVKVARVLATKDEDSLIRDGVLEADLAQALTTLTARAQRYDLKWCLPRLLTEDDALESPQETSLFSNAVTTVPVVLSNLSWGNQFASVDEVQNATVINPSCCSTILGIQDRQYIVPGRSSFIWGTIEAGLYPFKATRRSFDVVVMDPPWDNRSVRRSRSYQTSENQSRDPFMQTIPIIEQHLALSGVVAVWVTNKARVRNQVIQALQDIGMELRSEWTWLKVTSSGEPVTKLDGVWRKPYETVLLFLHKTDPRALQRQMIIAVPDLHSRKPSLKHLLKEILPEKYEGLELFARYLTEGWFSWGLEVLKYQDTRAWG